MSRRNKIIIITMAVIVVVLLIIIALLWWLNNRQEPIEVVNTNEGIQIPVTLPSASAGLTASEESPVKQPDLEADLKAIATTFAERFGSYSNEGNFSNLDALRDIMTIKMKTWADNYKITKGQEITDNPVYYGITTQALSADIIDFDELLGRAGIMVTTQRREARGSTINPRVFYQNIKLQLVKTGEGWKVDIAEWQ